MLKWCVQRWDENKDKLREAIKERVASDEFSMCLDYDDLAELISRHIFVSYGIPYTLLMTTGLRSDYQGSACFIFGRNGNDSTDTDILMSRIYYGSCTVCDTIQAAGGNIDDLMTIAKDIVTNTIKPFNSGWDHDSEFDEIVYEISEEDANGESF